ncbi:MAG: DNA-binding protein [Flavobacteriaceae bacterium]|nr:DNA-binding protein [Flavobacteriaceae bacterium]
MNYQEIRSMIEEMAKENHEDFVKALISFEKGIHDKDALNTLYERYMENDSMSLLHEEFDYMIDELRESGQIRGNVSFEKEENDLVDIVGNVVGKMEVIERISKTGESFEVVNFSVVSKDTEGNKYYTNCSAYGEKADIPIGFKPGDFVKIFGQERKYIDENGKEHRNVKILSSKLLKEKEKTKEKVDKNESVLETIKKFKIEEKAKLHGKMGFSKGVER